MKQEVQLTSKALTVGEVHISDLGKDNPSGLIYKDDSCAAFHWVCYNDKTETWFTKNKYGETTGTSYKSLELLIKKMTGGAVYLLDNELNANKIIIGELPLTIDDLKNTDHVGFVVSSYGKGYISPNQDYILFAISVENYDSDRRTPNSTFHNKCLRDMTDILEYLIKGWKVENIYRFDTRRELYQWLAED